MNFRDALRVTYGSAEADLNRYMKQLDKEDARESAIEARANELLHGEYSPVLPLNIAEAFGEMSQDRLTQIALAMAIKSNNMTGSLVETFVREYWETLAREKATDEVEEEERACAGCSRKGKCYGCPI